MEMSTVAFHTLGCKVNFYDTEGIWQLFRAAGYAQVPFEETADVYVVNTCTVTHTGDKKSRQMIRRAVRTNPGATVVVTGCYAQMAPDEIAAIEGVDLVVGNDRKSKIVELVDQVRREQHPYQSVGNILKTRTFEELDVPYFEERTRASLKIQDGCNNFCTFCIIPHARGLVRSRQPAQIVAQARKLARAGYREIILTGIHTGGYGADLDGYRLAQLLQALEAIDELYRVRISSIEASEIDDELISVLGQSRKVAPHLHIPLQAGHDTVLRRMNRHYTVAEFAATLSKLRAVLPDLAITSDIIVGFPGETDEQFAATESFVVEQAFSQLHVFPYSPRKGTPAAKFPDQVAEDVKEQRVQRLLQCSAALTTRYAERFVGRILEVIPEVPDAAAVAGLARDSEAGQVWLTGHADNYLKVTFPVPAQENVADLVGEVCRVTVTQAASDMQTGSLVGRVTESQVQDVLDEGRYMHAFSRS